MNNNVIKYLKMVPIVVSSLLYSCASSNFFISKKYHKDYSLVQNISDTIYNHTESVNNLEIKKDYLFDSLELLLQIDNKNIKNLRTLAREKIHEQYGEYVFGKYLDTVTNQIKDNYSAKIAKDTSMIKKLNSYSIEIPKFFHKENLDFYFIASKKDLTLKMYSKSEDKLMLETKIAVGRGINGDRFDTPKGTFYLKRVIQNPWYYPPKWAEKIIPEKPGPYNSYGLWMGELCKDSTIANYEFSPNTDTGFRIHSTNNPKSIGSKTSHGCIRIHPNAALEIFNALLDYTPHKIAKKNSRGTISPLDKPIKITITD